LDLTVTLEPHADRTALFGPHDQNLRLLRELLSVQVVARGSAIKLAGSSEAVGTAASVIERMQRMLRNRQQLNVDDVHEALSGVAVKQTVDQIDQTDQIEVFARGASVVPKTAGQVHYMRAVTQNDLVFCMGPAGTGKTYLAVAMAVAALKKGTIKRIVLVRPAVEAGERLGFLPGDLYAKVNPYLRPLLDAMHDMMSFDQIKRFTVNDVIEVIPLAYMRGRTLNNAVVILDEAQNTTTAQMLMFLTRLGHHSKMIVTGDDSQIDLEPGQTSGLIDAGIRLRNMDGIAIIRLTKADIVRHRLVQDIVDAYATDGSEKDRQGNSEDK